MIFRSSRWSSLLSYLIVLGHFFYLKHNELIADWIYYPSVVCIILLCSAPMLLREKEKLPEYYSITSIAVLFFPLLGQTSDLRILILSIVGVEMFSSLNSKRSLSGGPIITLICLSLFAACYYHATGTFDVFERSIQAQGIFSMSVVAVISFALFKLAKAVNRADKRKNNIYLITALAFLYIVPIRFIQIVSELFIDMSSLHSERLLVSVLVILGLILTTSSIKSLRLRDPERLVDEGVRVFMGMNFVFIFVDQSLREQNLLSICLLTVILPYLVWVAGAKKRAIIGLDRIDLVYMLMILGAPLLPSFFSRLGLLSAQLQEGLRGFAVVLALAWVTQLWSGMTLFLNNDSQVERYASPWKKITHLCFQGAVIIGSVLWLNLA
jgi:hypothetical protein